MDQRVLVVCRVHEWDDYIRSMVAHLSAATEGLDFRLAVDTTHQTLNVECSNPINLSERNVEGLGLFIDKPGSAFYLHGDYALYNIYEEEPGYDYYCLLDYDIYAGVSLLPILSEMCRQKCDLVISELSERQPNWVHYAAARKHYECVWGSLFAFVFISKRSLEFCLDRRKYYSTVADWLQHWPMCEAFVPSEMKKSGIFNMHNLNVFTSIKHFRYMPPYLLDDVILRAEPAIYHPVLDSKRYVKTRVRWITDVEIQQIFSPNSDLAMDLKRFSRPDVMSALASEFKRLKHELTADEVARINGALDA